VSFLIASGHVEVEAKTDKAMTAITGLVGALGAVGPVAGVAAAGLAAAGAGVAAFGLAAGKQIADLKKASEAQSKYQEAVDQSGKHSQDAAKAQREHQRILASMPKATQEATAAWAALKDEYKEWSDALAGDTMPVFTHSFQLFQALLPKTTGLVQGTSREMDRLVTLIAGSVASPGFDAFMAKLTEFSTGVLHHMVSGVIDLSHAVTGFAAEGGFDDFLDTAREAGPLLAETLGNLAQAFLNLAAAGGDVGIGLLAAANALAELVNSVPPEVLSTFLQLYAALRLVSVGAAAVTAVTTSAAATGLAAFVRSARFGGVGPAIAGVTQRMSALQKVAGGLGVLGAVAIGIDELADHARGAPPDVDKLVTSLKNLASTGEVTGELRATIGTVDEFAAKLNSVKAGEDVLAKALDPARFAGAGPAIDVLLPRIDSLVNKGDGFEAFKEDVKGFDEALAAMVSSGYSDQAADSFARYEEALRASGRSQDEINQLFPEYKAAVAGLKAEQELAAQGMGLFGQQAIETKGKLDQQKSAADGLRQSLIALNEVNRAGSGAMNAFEAAIDNTATVAAENANALRMVKGELDLNSEGARKAEESLRNLATSTDGATTAALEQGKSWEHVNGIYSRGRQKFIEAADAMGLTKEQATQLADEMLSIPDSKKLKVEMATEDAAADLDAFLAAVKKTPNAKSVRLDAITEAGKKKLEELGYKVTHMKDGSVTVSALTGTAQTNIKAVQAARDRLSGKSISIGANPNAFWAGVRGLVGRVLGTSYVNVQYRRVESTLSPRFRARGGPIGLAGGGSPGGRIAGPGTSTSDSIPAMLSDGEWVIRASAVEKYGDSFMAAVNEGRLRLPGFASGGKPKKLTEKQKAELQRQKEGRSALTGDVTFSTAGKLAGYKNAELMHNLGMPESVSSLVNSINKYLSDIKKAFTGKTETALVSQMTRSGKALIENQKRLEAVNKRLDAAKDTLEDLRGKFDQLKTSVSSSLVSFANITKIGKYGTSPETLIKQLQSDTSRTTEFASMLEQLKGKGLNAQSISEIAQAGITGGGMATAQSLLNATPEQIKQINQLEAQLKASADKAGTVTADAMYGAGVRAAEGLVKGLTAQQNAIEATMMAIAKSMERAIKKALGIKSPSKLMEPVGAFAMQGVEVGWTKQLGRGNTLLSGRAAGLRVRPALQPGAATPAAAGASVVVHLNPAFNMLTLPPPAERKAFAAAMAKDLNDALLDYQKGRRR
jgi:hypothetical protein